MNEHQVKGQWKQFSGKIRDKWGKLTDDEIAQAEGKLDRLIGKIQERYGQTEEEIRRDLKALRDSL